MSAVSGQLMQPGFSMAAYLLSPLIHEVDPFQPRQELPVLDTYKFPSSCRSLPDSLSPRVFCTEEVEGPGI